jgi:hypothetical protein
MTYYLKVAKRLGYLVQVVCDAWKSAEKLYVLSRGNLLTAASLFHTGDAGTLGAGNAVEVLILIFVAIIVIYQLIPQVSTSNVAVQASENVTDMGKFAAGLGEWLFPLLGIIAIVFLLFRKGKGSRGGA